MARRPSASARRLSSTPPEPSIGIALSLRMAGSWRCRSPITACALLWIGVFCLQQPLHLLQGLASARRFNSRSSAAHLDLPTPTAWKRCAGSYFLPNQEYASGPANQGIHYLHGLVERASSCTIDAATLCRSPRWRSSSESIPSTLPGRFDRYSVVPLENIEQDAAYVMLWRSCRTQAFLCRRSRYGLASSTKATSALHSGSTLGWLRGHIEYSVSDTFQALKFNSYKKRRRGLAILRSGDHRRCSHPIPLHARFCDTSCHS